MLLLLVVVRVLEVLEFTSARKRMSVIVERDDGRVQLLAKGADTVRGRQASTSAAEVEEAKGPARRRRREEGREGARGGWRPED